METDKEYEKLRRRRLAKLQKEIGEVGEAEGELEEGEEVEKQRRLFLRQLLTSQALGRLERVRLGHSELGRKVEDYLLLFAQSGKLTHQVNDEELKSLLMKLTQRKEIKIKRK
jgi:programmed cell death protein 5